MEMHYGHPSRENIVGNIYKGRVQDVLPGLGSAFVDVGAGETLFLSAGEINNAMRISSGYGPRKRQVGINKLVRSQQEIIIQVRRAGIGSKNPQGTTKISLPGRYWVYLPKEDRIGISRRIPKGRTYRRLRRTASKLIGNGEGLIARTAAQWANRSELKRDYNRLVETWNAIEKASQRSSAPKLLYKAMGVVQTILRDRISPDVKEVVVNSRVFEEKMISFLRYENMERYEQLIDVYEGDTPLFAKYEIEGQIDDMLGRRVSLRGGGFLVIDETEALTAIDVNTGSDVRHPSQSAAILNANLQAAEEIARQLRLRKISGIIIVDFVDMEDPSHIDKLIMRVKELLNEDRVPADFIDLTGLGLIEITRKCEGESLADMLENAEFEA